MPTALGANPSRFFLALQILQVTSLSITFSLAYDTTLPPFLPSSRPPPPQQLSSTSNSRNKRSTRGRGRKSKKSSVTTLSSSTASHSALHPSSDTEGDEGDDNDHDLNEQDHLHYPGLVGACRTPDGMGEDLGESLSGSPNGRTHLAVLMSRGLAVTVNGSPWRSVAAHVIDDRDEAIVVVYGLSPGEEYTVELGLIADEDTKANAWTTAKTLSQAESSAPSTSASHPNPKHLTSALSNASNPSNTVRSRSRANSLRRSRANSSSSAQVPTALHNPASTSIPSPQLPTSPSTPTSLAATSSLSVEALTSLLKHQLDQFHTQQSVLSTELKSQRRTSQKNEAQVRLSIQALQRTLEKNSAGDLRGRQKVLALGEAVKRLTVGKEEVDLERKALEEEVWGEQVQEGEDPTMKKTKMGLEGEEEKRRVEWEAVEKNVNEVEKERDEVVGTNERELGEWESELSGLVAKLEKLNGKHERLRSQAETLQTRLENVSKERTELLSGTHPILLDTAVAPSSLASFPTNQPISQGGGDRERTSFEQDPSHHSYQVSNGVLGQAFRPNNRPLNTSGGRGIGNGFGLAPSISTASLQAQQAAARLQYRPFGNIKVNGLPQQTISATSAMNSSQTTVPPFRPHAHPQAYHFQHPSASFPLQPYPLSSASGSQPLFLSFGDISNGFASGTMGGSEKRYVSPSEASTLGSSSNPNEAFTPPFNSTTHSSAPNSASTATFPPLPSQRESPSASSSPSISNAQPHHSLSLADIVTKGATSTSALHQHFHFHHPHSNPKLHHPFPSKQFKPTASPPFQAALSSGTRVQQVQDEFPPLSPPVLGTPPGSRKGSGSSAAELAMTTPLPTSPTSETH